MEDEHISVKNMWRDYLLSMGENPDHTKKSYTSWYFCDNEKDADVLAKLVREGTKRGTTSVADLYRIDGDELPAVGNLSIVTNWVGIAQCVIETQKVTVLPFRNVTEEFAKIEGEGDKTLKYWREAHIDAFSRELPEYGITFSEDLNVVFEEFKAVYPKQPVAANG